MTMSVSEIIDVSITMDTRVVESQSFSTPLAMAYHDKWPDLVRSYDADTADTVLTSEGFAAGHPARKLIAAAFRLDPKPALVKLGRLPLPGAKDTHTLTVDSAVVEGDVVSLTVVLPDGTESDITHTVAASGTPTTAATALELLIEALAGIDSTASAAVITMVASAYGSVLFVKNCKNIVPARTTADLGYAAALDAIRDVDDDFYATGIDVNSPANLTAMATWAETKTKVFGGHLFGTRAAYVSYIGAHTAQHRSFVMFAAMNQRSGSTLAGLPGGQDDLYPGFEAVSFLCANAPGSVNLWGKQLPGVNADAMTTNDRNLIATAKGNTYRRVGGIDMIQDGQALSGRFMDLTVGADWLTNEIAITVFAWLVAQKKVEYTDDNAEIARSLVKGVLGASTTPVREGGQGILRADPAPTVTVPKVASVSLVNRGNRLLPDVKFFGELAGAIQGISIRGNLSI